MEFNYPKYHKTSTLNNWKRSGVIYHDFDELYELYIKTMNCWHCNKEFVSTIDRCLDHNHDTGAFRAIVCKRCNAMDSYIKYPNGYDIKEVLKQYREENKQEINQNARQEIKCLCGTLTSKGHIARHKKTPKHLKNMDKYMENVD